MFKAALRRFVGMTRFVKSAVAAFDFPRALGYNKYSVLRGICHRFTNSIPSAEALMTHTSKGWSVFFLSLFFAHAVFAEPNERGAHDQGAGTGTSTARAQTGDLNNQAFCILQNRCAKCHDEATAEAQGEKVRRFGGILDLKTLMDSGKIVPRNPDQSSIFLRMASTTNPMPPKPQLVGGDERLRLHQAETETIRRWIAEGAPAFPATPNCVADAKEGPQPGPNNPPRDAQAPVVRPEDVLLRVAGDILKKQPYDPRRNEYVYFSLAHLRGSPDDNATTRRMYRDALTQQINNTSRNSKIILPEQVDKEGYLFRVRPADLGWSTAAFNLIKGSDNAFNSKVIDSRRALQVTPKMVDAYINKMRNDPEFAKINPNDPRVPAHLRMMAANPNDPRLPQVVAQVLKQYQQTANESTVSLDHFVNKSAQWDGYKALLRLPDTQNEVLGGYDWRLLLTQAAAGLSNLPVHKYFMRVSRADRNQTNREATYFNLPATTRQGVSNLFKHVILSSNYDDNLGKNNASRYPLSGVQDVPENLKSTPNSHDGIGQLPNGLVAFFRHDDKGQTDAEIIEKGPVFCMSCHTSQNGIFEFTDEGQNILDRIASGEIPPQYHAKVQRLYRGEKQLGADLAIFTDGFKAASQQMGLASGNDIHPELRNPEFVSKGSKANALAFTSQSGGNAVVLVSEKQANNVSIAEMARRAGTTPEYLRMVMSRRDIQVLLGNPGRVEEIQPDLFNAAMPAIMEAIPLVDPSYGQITQGGGGQFNNYYGPGYSAPGLNAYGQFPQGQAFPQGAVPIPEPIR